MFSDDYRYYLWKTIHIFVFIVQQIIRSYNGIKTNIQYSFNKTTKSEKVLIDECKQLCDKIPKHIVLILGERQVDFSSLSNIIFWASLADIKCISIYDYTGKKNLHITPLNPYVWIEWMMQYWYHHNVCLSPMSILWLWKKKLFRFSRFLIFVSVLQGRFWANDNDFWSIWKRKRIYFMTRQRKTSVTVRSSTKTASSIPWPWTYWIRDTVNFRWANCAKALRGAVNRHTSSTSTHWTG